MSQKEGRGLPYQILLLRFFILVITFLPLSTLRFSKMYTTPFSITHSHFKTRYIHTRIFPLRHSISLFLRNYSFSSQSLLSSGHINDDPVQMVLLMRLPTMVTIFMTTRASSGVAIDVVSVFSHYVSHADTFCAVFLLALVLISCICYIFAYLPLSMRFDKRLFIS